MSKVDGDRFAAVDAMYHAQDLHAAPPWPPPASGAGLVAAQRASSVIVVEDETGFRQLLTEWLQEAGYAVASAASAEDALGQMEHEPAAVALCDIGLPGRDGLWLADRIRRGYPETAVIMATGSPDVEPAVESLRQGVVDYLTKPFGRDRLEEAMLRGVGWHASARDLRRSRDEVDRAVTIKQVRLADAIAALRLDSDQQLDAMLALVTIHDRESYRHAHRVSALAVLTARALWVEGDELTAIARGALLHDIGKLAIPQAVLLKAGPLSVEERRLIRTYPSIGSALLAEAPYLASAAAIVRDAQERVDGLGFPAGRRAAEIGIGARIVGVADAFDTMVRPRPYREPVPVIDALAELERCSGTQFERRVVDAFRRVVSME